MQMNPRLAMYALTAVLCVSAGTLIAQDNKPDAGSAEPRPRGNFDPAQFQQRMMDNVRIRLAFSNDAEWAVVQPLVQKVMDARRETMSGMGRMGGRGPNRDANSSTPGSDNRANAFGKPAPEAESLQKLLDDKVPSAEIKTALEKYRTSRKDKEAKLASAQEDLRKVLTVRQEAQAALLGLVP